jgi:maltokinase
VLASRLAPEESGGDFAGEAARLGSVIAELHLAMADAWGSEAGDPGAWVEVMAAGIDDVAGSSGSPPFDAAAVRARLEHARNLDDAGAEICIHGDLHLAQVIQLDGDWLVLDFEGEPSRRRDDRFTRSSPLRDVAGMLRSFHYAAATGLAEWDQGDEELLALLDAWEKRNRDAFLAAYFAEPGIDALLPADPAGRAALLTAFELDKAVYELGYEIGHRPELVAIPRAGIDRLVARPVPS